MLNPFPELLVYSFFAPTLLRVAVALAFLYIAYMQYLRRTQISALHFPIVGQNFAWFAIAFHTIVGVALLVGYYTQVAAIVAIAGLVKGWWLNKRYPSVVIVPTSTILLLLVICLSLLLSGAGALAFDVPL